MKTIANKLEEVKDSVYELEGLLELARLRGDKAQELIPLMKGKIEEINRIFSEVSGGEIEETNKENPVAAEQEYTRETWSASEPLEEAVDEEEPEAETESEQEAAEAMAEAAEFEEEEHAAENPEIEKTAEEKIPEDIPEEEVPTAVKEKRVISEATPKPAFCINDRFRFRRELFGGSDADFSAAMDLVATMENYEEAEQYFTEEMGWSVEDPDVADFLAIIERYFER